MDFVRRKREGTVLRADLTVRSETQPSGKKRIRGGKEKVKQAPEIRDSVKEVEY